MRKVFVVTLLLAGTAFAQQESEPDAIGQWLNSVGGRYSVDPTLPGTPIVDVSFESRTGSRLNSGHLERLTALKHLRRLSLQDCRLIDDNAIPHLKQITSLESLSVGGTSLSPEALAELRSLPKLRELSINWRYRGVVTRRKTQLLEAVATLPKLQALDVRDSRIGDTDIAKLKNHPGLRSLSLAGTQVTSDGLAVLASLPSLRSLDLSQCRRLSDSDLRHLTKLSTLEELRLDGYSNSSQSESGWMSAVQSSLRVTGRDRLADYRGGTRDAALVSVGRLTNLKTLSLVKTRVTNEGLKALAPLRSLEVLDLSMTAINDGLADLPTARLRELNLKFTPLNDSAVQSFAGMKQLERLSLYGTPVRDTVVPHLAALPNLSELNLYGTYVGDQSVEALAGLPLRQLNVAQSNISVPGLIRLADLSRELTLVDLLCARGDESHYVRGRADADDELLHADLSASGLVYLHRPPQARLTDEQLRRFSRSTRLQSLNLSRTDVTDSGLAAITGLTRLLHLTLDDDIGEAGLTHLRKMSKLATLRVNKRAVKYRAIRDLFVEHHGRDLAYALNAAAYRPVGVYPVIGPSDFRTPIPAPHRKFFVGQTPPARLLKRGASKEKAFYDLGGAGVSDDDLRELAALPSLGAVLLDENPLTDAGLRTLANAKQLELLWVAGPAITVAGLEAVSRLPELHSLWLTDASISDDDLEHLRSLPRLRHLNLSGCPISDSAVDVLAGCEHLQFLVVDADALSAAARKRLRAARPGLFIRRSQAKAIAAMRGRKRVQRQLALGSGRTQQMAGVKTVVSPFPARFIFGDAHFEVADRLSLSGDDQLKQADEWPTSVTSLQISNATIDKETMRGVARLRHLKSVSISRSTVSPAALEVFAGKPVAHFSLSSCTLTDDDFSSLSELHMAENVRFFRVDFPDGRLPQMPPGTKWLNAEQCELVTLGEIAGLTKLERLELGDTLISDEELKRLKSIKSLRQINLYRTYVSEPAVEELKTALPDARIIAQALPLKTVRALAPLRDLSARVAFNAAKQISSVDLRPVGDGRFRAALDELGKHPQLIAVQFGNRATDAILNEIGTQQSIVSVDVRRAAVSDDGLLPWVRTRRMTHIYADGTRVSDALFSDTSRFDAIQSLDLSQTGVTDAVCDAVSRMPRLNFLDLSDTKVTDVGLQRFLATPNPALAWLYLDGLNVTDATLDSITSAPKLQVIRARNSRITAEGIARLKKRFPRVNVTTE